MSGGQSPRVGELICPITEDLPFSPKSAVQILKVNAFSFTAGTTVTVLVCSQQYNDPRQTFCSSKGKTATSDGEYLSIEFDHNLLAANAWSPEHANDFGYVRIRFSEPSGDPQAVVTGIFLFFD